MSVVWRCRRPGRLAKIAHEIDDVDGWPPATRNEVRIDNVNYARPAYHVSPTGDHAQDGLTERTAFAMPQKAVDVAEARDSSC